MACRHLYIRFLETGDVKYQFFRHHSRVMLQRYLIEWPADRVRILGGQCLEDHNFRTSVTSKGYLLLEWDRVPEAATGLGRGVDYLKLGYLTRLANEPALWHYQERFRIKPDVSLWLHSPFDRINAIHRRSSAVFLTKLGREYRYCPRELSERVFLEEGELVVDWILETLDEARTCW